MRAVLTDIFGDWRYLLLGLAGALVLLVCIAVLGNSALFFSVFGSASLGLVSKIGFTETLILSAYQNMPLFGLATSSIIALLFGLNLMLAVYHVRARAETLRPGSVVTGGLGLFAGLFGAGCSACGPVFVAAIIPFLGGGATALLPFDGMEFAVLGIILSLLAAWLFLRAIKRSTVCAI